MANLLVPINVKRYIYVNIINIGLIVLACFCVKWNEDEVRIKKLDNYNIEHSNTTCVITGIDYRTEINGGKMYVRIFWKLGNTSSSMSPLDKMYIKEYPKYDPKFFPIIGSTFECWYYEENLTLEMSPLYNVKWLKGFTYFYISVVCLFICIQSCLFCCWKDVEWGYDDEISNDNRNEGIEPGSRVVEQQLENVAIELIQINSRNIEESPPVYEPGIPICKVCFINPISMVAIPCSHLAICQECSLRIPRCVICNKIDIRYIKVYLS
jgi:hypothetical protein